MERLALSLDPPSAWPVLCPLGDRLVLESLTLRMWGSTRGFLLGSSFLRESLAFSLDSFSAWPVVFLLGDRFVLESLAFSLSGVYTGLPLGKLVLCGESRFFVGFTF